MSTGNYGCIITFNKKTLINCPLLRICFKRAVGYTLSQQTVRESKQIYYSVNSLGSLSYSVDSVKARLVIWLKLTDNIGFVRIEETHFDHPPLYCTKKKLLILIQGQADSWVHGALISNTIFAAFILTF